MRAYQAEMERKVDAGEYVPGCSRCNLDLHRCPGCGEPGNHKQEICDDCSKEG